MITLNGDYTIEQLADMVTDYMVKTEVKKCLCCAENMTKSAHVLSIVMVNALAKAYRYVIDRNENVIDRKGMKEILTNDEDGNWTKLRFHGLIAKLKVNGTHKRGHWVITRRGADFLKGHIQIPNKVWTFRNKIVERSDELISVGEVLGSGYFSDTQDTLFFEPLDDNQMDDVRVFHKVTKKKRKNPCPLCEKGELKKKIEAEIIDNIAHTTTKLVCNNCGAQSTVTV